jgi:hypothetical protein
METALRASLGNSAGVCLRSREPRLAPLPPDRHVDTRAARRDRSEETAHLGPGAYGGGSGDACATLLWMDKGILSQGVP